MNHRPTPSPPATVLESESKSKSQQWEGGAQESNPQPHSSNLIATQPATKNAINPSKAGNSKQQEKVGMMVSLDHTIYFHRPREVRVDEWMCSEMESPWAGEGRGVVMQRIWNRKGVLLATCVQEVRSFLSPPLFPLLCVSIFLFVCGGEKKEGKGAERRDRGKRSCGVK